jgi:hypothetical protein
MAIINIFRAGKHTTSSGQVLEFSANDIAMTAFSYNNNKHKAPLVIGHPNDNQPVYGWVESLTSNNDNLFAEVGRLSPAIVDAVRAGFYKYLSSAFYPKGSADNPDKGIWSLRHIGLLGAQPPAVKGLGQVSFCEGLGLIGTAEFTEIGLWSDLSHASEIAMSNSIEFACPRGFTVDKDALKMHQAAIHYQHSHGVEYLEAVLILSK